MESVAIAVRVVAPLFVLMAVGYAVRQLKVVPADTFLPLNNLCFKLFLPAALFRNIVSADITAAFNGRVMCYVTIMQALTLLLVLIIVPRLVRDKPQAASCAQGVFRSNFVAVGIALITNIVDTDGLALVSLLGASTVPMFNVCSVVILESLRGGKIRFKSFIKNILTNPLTIASALGVAVLLCGARPAGLAKKVIDDLSAIATPLAVICLGGLFNFANIQKCLAPVIIGTAGRLFAVPALALWGAALMGFRGGAFLSIAAVFIPPTAVVSFAMAKQMDADGDTAAALIVFTSVFSLVSMAFWLALTHHLRLW